MFIISTSAGLTYKINRQVSFRFQSYLSGKDLESLNIEKFGHRRFKSLATGTVGEILLERSRWSFTNWWKH